MVKMPLIDEWSRSRFGFYTDRWYDAETGRWVLEKGPIKLAPYHARLLRHIFTPDDDGRLRYDTVAWCEPAKSGKSALAGLMAEYAALHLDGDVVLASNKRAQAASLMYKSLTDSIEWNPHLPNVEPNRYECEFKNGNMARAIPSSYRGEAGARFSLFVVDELWGYIYEDSQRLWGEFKTDPTRLSSMKMAVGYAGYLESDLWKEQLDKGLAGEPVAELLDIEDGRGNPACWRNGRHFAFWSHECKQPWQTPEWIESQRQSLRPAQFSRMILADFTAGVGDFIDPLVWAALVDPGHEPLEPHSLHRVYIGLDVAIKVGGDDCALVGIYSEGGVVKLAFHKVWRGGRDRIEDLRISQTVKPALLEAARRCNLGMIGCDPWGAYQLIQDLQWMGLPVIEVIQSHAGRGPSDTLLYELALSGNLVLYDNPEVVGAAASVSGKELGNNQVFITKAGGRGKIDWMIALSNALTAMMQPLYLTEVIEFPRVPIDSRY